METTLTSRHSKCLSVVHKDQSTIFMLLRDPQATSQLKVIELDITTQTVCSSTLCLVFEGVQPHDTNYSLLYSSGFLVLIYPSQMVCIYQDNEYFARRSEDSIGCRGLSFFDLNLTAQDNSSRIALKHVVQSQLRIETPLLVETNLIFISRKPSNASESKEANYLVHVPLTEIDILGHPNRQAIFPSLEAKLAKEKEIFTRKSPLVDLASRATDMVQVARHSFAVAFTCGTLWVVNAKSTEQEFALLGLAYIRKFLGQESKTACINTLDHVLIPWKQDRSLHPDQFDAVEENGPRVTEFLVFGDALGNLVLFKNREPVFQDQITYNQVAAVKFLNVSLTFAVISTDGVLRINRFCPLPRKAADSNNLFEIVKLASIQSFQELNSQLKLNQISLRGSMILQTRAHTSPLESSVDSLQVLWPNRVLMKVKNASKTHQAEDQFSAECRLQVFRIFQSVHPMVKRSITPIVLSNVLPCRFRDFVVQPDAESGAVEMTFERHCFLVDQLIMAGSQKPQVWISVYDYAKDKKTPLVNVTAESGVHDMDHFSVVRLDMRSEGRSNTSGIAKFLVTLEYSNGQSGVSGLCCSFAVDMETGSLAQNVLQLSGRTGIYLGKLDYKDPSILVLQEEMKSLIIFSFDEGDLESKLPHGEVRLSSKVNGVYWTPMRDGLAVLYELQQENLLTFSKNRLARYSVKDFGILVSRNIGLKLHYEERIFDVKWTGFSIGFASDDTQAVKGVVGTNQHIYFVDDNLHALGVVKWTQQPITSLQWLGDHTVLATTKSHLVQVYGERHPKIQVIFSLTESLEETSSDVNHQNTDEMTELPVVVKALADRVIFAARKHAGTVEFFCRPMLMLEPILLGYLASTPVGKVDVESVQNSLKYLDTVAISQKLLQALSVHGMAKSVKFMLKNQPMLTSKVGLQPHQILRIEDFDDFLQTLFPKRDLASSNQDLVDVRKKLSLDPVSLFQKKLLQKRAQYCVKKGQLLDAFVCGDLLQDVDLQMQILKQASIDEAVILEFLTQASKTNQHTTVNFDYKGQLRNRRNVGRVLKRVPEKNIQKLMLAFDEVPLAYSCPDGPEGSEKIIPAAPVPFNAENFSTFIGVAKYVDLENLRNDGNGLKSEGRDDESEISDDAENNGAMEIDSDGHPDDVDEKRHLRAYWRGEEGHGCQIADISDRAMHLVASQLDWHPQVNQDGDPIDYQDKWGKVNTANYSFALPQSGLAIAKKNNHALGSKAAGQFTLEMWLREPEPQTELVLALIIETDSLSLFLNKEQGRLTFQLYDLKSKDSPVTRELAADVSLNQWTHIAVKQKQEKITLLLNFEPVAEFQGRTFNAKDPKAEFTILNAISAPKAILATELRLWQVALSTRQLKSMARQPLATLFEQKRNLNIQINKNKAKSGSSKPLDTVAVEAGHAVRSGEEQKLAPQKKKGGLKFTSKLDTNKAGASNKPAASPSQKKPSPQKPDPKEEEKQQPSILEKQPISALVEEEKSAFAFDDFNMGPPVNQAPLSQDNLFSFADAFSDSVAKDNPPEGVVAQADFFSFDQFGSAPVEEKKEPAQVISFSGFEAFSSNNSGPTAKDEAQEQSSSPATATAAKEVASSFDAFNFASVEPFSPEDEEEEGKQIPEMKPTQSVNILDSSFQSEVSSQQSASQAKLRLGDLLNSAKKPSNQSPQNQAAQPRPDSPLQEEYQDQELQPMKHQQQQQVNLSPAQRFDQLMEAVERAIAEANMPEAASQLQLALTLSVEEAKKVTSNEEKLAVKNRIRRSIVLKFTCDLATKIAEVKEKVKISENPYQKANMQSQLASMANVLILLKLPDALRINFFRFALRQNHSIGNFSALSKICSFWRKYAQTPEGQQFTTEKDKQKIAETEAQCKSRQNRNVQQYHGDDCPDCGANLAFGLATPQCHKCKAKIAICYRSLKPILKEKQTLKCHVCLAQFSLFIVQVNVTCPYCQLVKLKLSTT